MPTLTVIYQTPAGFVTDLGEDLLVQGQDGEFTLGRYGVWITSGRKPETIHVTESREDAIRELDVRTKEVR